MSAWDKVFNGIGCVNNLFWAAVWGGGGILILTQGGPVIAGIAGIGMALYFLFGLVPRGSSEPEPGPVPDVELPGVPSSTGQQAAQLPNRSFCRGCERELSADARFCGRCGQPAG